MIEPLLVCSTLTTHLETPSPADMPSGIQERDGHTIYCAAHCYGAPIPDERTRTLSVLSLSRDGSELGLLQQVPLPEGTLMPISQALNAARTRLFTTAGKNGIACYELDPSDQGKIVGAAVCSAVTPEPFPTPYGVMPVDITLDGKGENAFVCNFLMGTISALSIDMDNRSLSNPKLCAPGHSGIPEKVRKIGPAKPPRPWAFRKDSPRMHRTRTASLVTRATSGWLWPIWGQTA